MTVAETSEDAAANNSGKRKTVFALFIPGGGMLAAIPAEVLARIQDLLEVHPSEAFHVMDGASSGSIVVAGLNIRDPNDPTQPKHSAAQVRDYFYHDGPRFMPYRPGRLSKMFAASAINLLSDLIDPERRDELIIAELRALCDDLEKSADPDFRALILSLRKHATVRWLSRGNEDASLQICEALGRDNADLKPAICRIAQLVYRRQNTNSLAIPFKKAAMFGLDSVKRIWAHDYRHDPAVPRETFGKLFGSARLSDCLRSVYIPFHDTLSNRKIIASGRKKDYFSTDPENETVLAEDNFLIVDSVMGSVAHSMLFPLHKIENGRLAEDFAFVHSPLYSVRDILRNKPRGTDVKLVILGTGHYFRAGMDADDVLQRSERYGVIGNLVKGQMVTNLEGHVMSEARKILREELGEQNIIEIMPRLAPNNDREEKELPSRDTSDTRLENILRIRATAQRTIIDHDHTIRHLCQMLADNMRALGQMTDEKHARITKKLSFCDMQHAPAKDIAPSCDDLFDQIFPLNKPETRTDKIKRLFRENMHALKDAITSSFRQNNDAPPPAPHF